MQLPEEIRIRAQKGRLPHGVILSGTGREELAKELAMAYLCETGQPPCGSCHNCRKVKQGIHPDLILVGKAGESLKVDDIRAMRRDAYIRPNEAERKVYLLCSAETMNHYGQNALLKLLEEGPPYAAFFFLCPNPEALLETLRSRCELFSMDSGEQQADARESALEFAKRIEAGEPLPLLEFCVTLEKWDREDVKALLDETIGILVGKALREGQLLEQITGLDTVRRACETNIGPGHVAGYLMAELIIPE